MVWCSVGLTGLEGKERKGETLVGALPFKVNFDAVTSLSANLPVVDRELTVGWWGSQDGQSSLGNVVSARKTHGASSVHPTHFSFSEGVVKACGSS